jgi:hypothetical protein
MVDGIYHPGQMSLRNVRKLNEREILQGTKPATNPGAMTRKTAAPTIAKQWRPIGTPDAYRGHAFSKTFVHLFFALIIGPPSVPHDEGWIRELREARV